MADFCRHALAYITREPTVCSTIFGPARGCWFWTASRESSSPTIDSTPPRFPTRMPFKTVKFQLSCLKVLIGSNRLTL
jgi:hypothetical protein